MGTTAYSLDVPSLLSLSTTRLHTILSILRTCNKANHPFLQVFIQNQAVLLSHPEERTRILAFCVLCTLLSDEASVLSLWDLNIVEEYGNYHTLRLEICIYLICS